jgi:ElaB/YqjD/DUF883 family membrane-anchored ribosome-binding protein
MDDSPEVIRQQMEETKIQLTEKLETLEHQVAETVQSTSSAVTSTVGAVQETVETVTGAVQEAVQTVEHAFDLRRQFDEHPWWVLGGAFAVGCLAEQLLGGPSSKMVFPKSEGQPTLSAEHRDFVAPPRVQTASYAAPAPPVHERSRNSAWDQIQNAIFSKVGEVIQKVSDRALPEIVNRLSEGLITLGTAAVASAGIGEFEKKNEPTSQPRPETEDRGRQVYMPTTERFRAGNPF